VEGDGWRVSGCWGFFSGQQSTSLSAPHHASTFTAGVHLRAQATAQPAETWHSRRPLAMSQERRHTTPSTSLGVDKMDAARTIVPRKTISLRSQDELKSISIPSGAPATGLFAAVSRYIMRKLVTWPVGMLIDC